MRNVSDKSYTGRQNTHFMFSIFSKDGAIFEIMWKNMVELNKPQMSIWCMHFVCWI